MKTAMQELHKHFIDEWSSPSDFWNPSKVIDKVESMIEKEKEQIKDAYNDAYFGDAYKYKDSEEYYNQTYKPETI